MFKIRSAKCVSCQFSQKEIYMKLEELIGVAIKDRTDVLPEEILENLIQKCSELPLFDGIDIKDDEAKDKLMKDIIECAKINKKDIEFQVMVSLRRQDLRLNQTKILEKERILTFSEEKAARDDDI